MNTTKINSTKINESREDQLENLENQINLLLLKCNDIYLTDKEQKKILNQIEDIRNKQNTIYMAIEHTLMCFLKNIIDYSL